MMKIWLIISAIISLSLTFSIILSNSDKPVVQGEKTAVSPTKAFVTIPPNSSSDIEVDKKQFAIAFCTDRVKSKINELSKLSGNNQIIGANLIFRVCLTEQGQEPFDLLSSSHENSNSTYSTSQDTVPTIKDFASERKQKCQQELIIYNTCLSEKIAAETEYNKCMNEKINNPYKTCFKSYNASKICIKPYCL